MSSRGLTVFSFENILREHKTILSLYNRAADLNEKYMIEVSKKNPVYKSLEQKLDQIEKERDSLQPATKLIAQDNLCQRALVASAANVKPILHCSKTFVRRIIKQTE